MSYAEVFIIESLAFENEDSQKDGLLLYQALKMYDKKPKYYYVRTRKELEKVLEFFKDSKYRYLHLSCHGSKSRVSLTLDSLTFVDFGTLIAPYMDYRRLFVSSCELVDSAFAKQIFPDCECHSIVGPTQKIKFTVANVSWMSFYHLMFEKDESKMKAFDIKRQVETINHVFGSHFKYYTRHEGSTHGFASVKLD